SIAPSAARLPANVPSFHIGLGPSGETPEVRLFRLSGAAAAPVDVVVEPIGAPTSGLRVRPAALFPGFAYRFEYERWCSEAAAIETQHFEATHEAPLPRSLGALAASGLRETRSDATGAFGYAFELTFALSDEMTPWAETYDLEVLVDGRSRAGDPWLLRKGEQPFELAACVDGSRAESRRVVVVARPAGFEAPPLTTSPLVLEAICPNARPSLGPQDPATPETAAASAPGGCALGTHGSLFDFPSTFLISALAAWRRRRRRPAH
ncbi:MAG: hypothetical protein KF819_39710, partial [Labilithrix sp.]|nr:hypothetical protein [Labilithrix sp.]